MIKVAFVGNPNVGKSALINAISGSKLKVGNWPGVTVEKKEAELTFEGEIISLVDLPGVYSLSPYSLEEKITRDFILNENPDVIVNVVDSTNLERNLYLTNLLKEIGKPIIIALNFYDEFEKLNYKLKFKEFAELTEVEIVPTSAIKKAGIKELMGKIISYNIWKKKEDYVLPFSKDILKVIDEVKENIKATNKLDNENINYLAIKLLERDSYITYRLKEKNIDLSTMNEELIKKLENKYSNDIETILAEQRYDDVNKVLKSTLEYSTKSRLDFTEKVDKIVLNKFIGLPLFFVIIAGVMGFVFNGSSPFIDFVDAFFADFVGKYVEILAEGTPEWVKAFLVDGLVGGVGGVLTFVPLMFFLYFFLAILEESGYMNRVAFIMDKIMRKVGLNGKAFVPMVIGFGCTVPSIYATRTLEDEGSRKLTAAISPFMSCGARLPVYGLFTAAFFGTNAGITVASIYLVGIVVAILLGLILKNIPEFQSEHKALLIELPPYRIPSFKVIMNSTWNRLSAYIKKATTIILGVLVLLWALTYFPNGGDAKESYMGRFGRTIAPVLTPTGFANRWEPVAAILPSIAAKEVVVGFMGQVLELNEGEEEIEEEEVEETTFIEDLSAQGVALKDTFIDSISGMISFDIAGLFATPDEEEIEEEGTGIIQATRNIWKDDEHGPLRAYSFMIFILLVVPCAVTLGAIKQEFGWKFLGKITVIMLLLPYIASTLVYQIGKFFF